MFEPHVKKKDEGDAIIVENISKGFRIPHEKRNTVIENITGIVAGRKQDYEEFCALENISFNVKKGEKLGIVGENGSGKSTLLKIISGVLSPDKGNVKVKGKIAPFLELGVGFNPELTAEENVRLYGAVMGISRKEIEEKFDDIFEFAELERFKQMKLKNFSSGMYMRLAFATATATDPEILLIDEVLAVGDEAFQRKCFDRMNEFKMGGKTIVLVTHDMETVKKFCDSALLLEHGRIGAIGNSQKVIDEYRKNLREKEEAILKSQQESPETAGKETSVPEKTEPLKNRWGSRKVEITEVKFFGKDRKEKYIFITGEQIIVKIKYSAKERIEKPVFGVAIYRNDGVFITGPNTRSHDKVTESIEGDGAVEYIIDSLPLLEGSYHFSAAIYDFDCTRPFDYHDKMYTFKVEDSKIKDYGVVYIPCRWNYYKKK